MLSRAWIIPSAILVLLFLHPLPALAASGTPQVDTSHISSFLDSLNAQTHGMLPPVTLTNVGRLFTTGTGPLSPGSMLRGVLTVLFGQLVEGVGLLGKLLAVGVAAAILEQLSHAFASKQVATFAYGIAYLAVIAIAVDSFAIAVGAIHGAITQMVNLMEAMLPVLTTLLASLGSISTAALFHPVVLLMVNVVAMAVATIVVPAIVIATVVELIGLLTGHQILGLASLLRQAGLTTLGLFLTFFVAVTAIYRVAGPVADTVILRTGKFISLSFVPVVGKLFADAAEVVFGSAFLLKQSISLAGAIALGFIVLVPLFKVVAMMFAYRLAGAALAPVGGAPVVKGLGAMATALLFLALAMLAVSFMLFLALTLALAGGRGLLP